MTTLGDTAVGGLGKMIEKIKPSEKSDQKEGGGGGGAFYEKTSSSKKKKEEVPEYTDLGVKKDSFGNDKLKFKHGSKNDDIVKKKISFDNI